MTAIRSATWPLTVILTLLAASVIRSGFCKRLAVRLPKAKGTKFSWFHLELLYVQGGENLLRGIAFFELGDIPKAIDYFQQHLDLARQAGERHSEGMALGNLGNAHAAFG